jgi:hypothetical protein
MFGWEKVSREDPYYQGCVAASTLGGALSGGMVGAAAGGVGVLPGVAAGTALGFGAGYLACPYLAPLIRRKLETGAELSSSEVKAAAHAMSRYAGVSSASDAVKLLAVTRSAIHHPAGKHHMASANLATRAQLHTTPQGPIVTAQTRAVSHKLSKT